MRKKTKRKLIWTITTTLCFLALAGLIAYGGKKTHAPAVKPQVLVSVPVRDAAPPLPTPKPEEETQTLVPVPAPEAPQKPEPPAAQKQARVAIVIDDMGVNPVASARAIRLASSVTLSFLPYAPKLKAQVAAAQTAGHEIMLHLPMEPLGPQDPGPGALLTRLGEGENADRLRAALDSFEGYDGVNNHMGSRFTSRADLLRPVMEELAARHLYFLDSLTGKGSVAAHVAGEAGVPSLRRDVFLDDDLAPAQIQRELQRLEAKARQNGSALAIGHPHGVLIDALQKWIPQAESRGIRVVPVRDLVKQGE